MILRLDPRFPLVWRTPDSLQLGVESPIVLLESVTLADERMLTALEVGVTRDGLAMIGADAGLNEAGIVTFLDRVEPALLPQDAATTDHVVVVTGYGPTSRALTRMLADAGARSQLIGPDLDAAPEHPDLAILVDHFVLAPELYGHWLRRDIPHLPVVFSDTVVRIGPMIEPGTGPCLYCLDRHRTDADPAWPAMASQLWGRSSPAEGAFIASEVAAIASRLALSHLAGRRDAAATSIRLDVETGRLVPTRWTRHPECACHGFADDPVSGTAAPRGIGKARAPRPGVPATRRGAVFPLLG